ncbi:metallophosphoesterase [Chitinophagaceae bacterium MMS25-I14]
MKKHRLLLQHALLCIVAGSVLSACSTQTKSVGKQPAGPFSFFVLGDWGNKGGGYQLPVARQMITQSKVYNPSLILTVGDNFYEDGVKDIHDEHWQLSYENVYKELTKKYPWYVTLGNHDYRGNVEAEMQYRTVNPQWNMPDRYYTFVKTTPDHQKVRFIVLDTDPYADAYYSDPLYKDVVKTQDTAKQTRWVKHVLETAKEPWKIVLGHHPVYCVKPKPGETESLKKTMAPLFEQYHVQAYICGHDHVMQYNLPGGTTSYIISGGGAKPNGKTAKEVYTMFSAGIPSFTAVTIKGNEMQFSFVDTNGTTVYHNVITR